MSLALISRNDDLKRLRDEGYAVDVSNGYLLVSHVPYVNAKREVAYGTLISHLQLAGDSTVKSPDHVALWAGGLSLRLQGVAAGKPGEQPEHPGENPG